ncbi:hypothetical protein P4631_09020 [Halalkalibacterium halodurans]|uniref:hypothetical protein n=1 Tax=Halalkalibacterium halodurans TaxID=86665 RepID=UPI002E1F34CA|nr:hypothetical protein [Halalkalibacterium halodurans]
MENYQITIENEGNVWVDTIFLDFLGKCEVNNALEEDNYVVNSIKPLNIERYDESADAKYRLEGSSGNGWIPVTVDYKSLEIGGSFKKVWIGGEVETFHFSYKIDPNSFLVRKDEVTNSIHVSFSAFNQ